MNIQAYKRGANIQVSEHFKSYEFEPDEAPDILQAEWIFIDLDTVAILEIVRGYFGLIYQDDDGVSIVITSGYRHPIHNQSIGSKATSMHCTGSAVDFKVIRKKSKVQIPPKEVYRFLDAIVYDGGVGLYNSFNHVDRRGERARWTG